MNSEIRFSGPAAPLAEESDRIRRAPAYDVKKAASYIPAMGGIRSLIDAAGEDRELQCFGRKAPEGPGLELLRREIEKVNRDHHRVSLIMADLNTRSGVAYRSAVPMCSQSTIKAIYAGALLDSRPEALAENGQYLRDAIVLSSNEAYENLREIYGKAPLLRWCGEAGVDAGFADMLYPRDRTARDMLKMWTRLYCFLNSGADRQNFGRYYADSIVSAAKERLGDRYPVQTKAGWENGLDEEGDYDPQAPIPARFTDGNPLNDECAINDTGIVYTEKGPYLFVIYTDYPFGIFRNYVTPNPLYGLTDALLAVHMDLNA